MAQRSARARSKLEKISQYAGPQATPQPNSAPASTVGVTAAGSPVAFYRGIPGSTSFNPTTGLLTPSASSIATGSSGYSSAQHPHSRGGAGGGRHGFAFYNKNGAAARKSALRSIFEGQSEKIRGRLEEALRNKKSASGNTSGNYVLGSGPKKLGDIREDRLLFVKRWDVGGGKGGVLDWDKLHRDPELWLSGGDTLVYLCPQGHPSHQYSKPSFRIKSSVLLDTESPFFRAILMENKNAPVAAVPHRTGPPSNVQRPLTPPSVPGSPMSMTFESLEQLDRKASLTGGSVVSPTVSNTSSISADGIKYAIYFPTPVGLNKEQTHKYHITTRNVFAVLFGKALVGVTLGETLVDLVNRLDTYIPPTVQSNFLLPESSTMAKKRKNRALDEGRGGNVGRVLEYLLNREFDDLRNCPDVAAGVLVFAEKFQLGELWREAFCHCVGMLNQMEGGTGYLEITPITKALIDRASLEIQVRTGFADSRLAGFQYDDMWPTSSLNPSPSRVAFEKFQKFLIKHYQSRFGAWPPPPQRDSNTSGGWGFGLSSGGSGTVGAFSRQIYIQLQKDFAALYDYLVDKDVSWEYPVKGNSSPSSLVGAGGSTSTLGTISGATDLKNKPKMVSPSKKHFKADDDNLPVTDILIVFDRRHDFPHIPHPYPLVPEMKNGSLFRHSTSGLTGIQNAHHHSGRVFLGKRNMGSNSNTLSSTQMAAYDKAAALALSESTNIHSLLSRTASNELVDAFARHEKEKGNSEFTPAEGRKGRWILIYGVLQTLATVVGDAPGLKYTDKVEYSLSSKLKGTPPWVSGGIPVDEGPGGIDDHHTRSHCWTVVGTWDIRRNSYITSDSQLHIGLTPKISLTSVNSTSTKDTSNSPATLRSIGVGVGDTTDTEAGSHGQSRTPGTRKRKAIPKMTQSEAVNINSNPVRNGLGESLSGDEGDDEADEDDEDVVMGEAKDTPPLERDIVEGELETTH